MGYSRVPLLTGDEFVSLVEEDERQPGELFGMARDPLVVQAHAQAVVQGLVEPTTLAIGPDGVVWVAEPRAGRVRGFSAAGTLHATLVGDVDFPFVEPYAVVVTAQNEVLVLDAEIGLIQRFASSGTPLGLLPVEPEIVMRSRGFFVEPESQDFWIAATARGEVIKFDAAGRILRTVPLRTGGASWQSAQPTSVVRSAAGTILVSDPGMGLVTVLSAEGRRAIAWEMTPANTFTGPQLALGRDGLVYRTAPEEGWLVVHSATGEPVLVWSLRSHDFPALRPVGVAVDESGIIWVADTQSGLLLRLSDETSGYLESE
jgi:sugar lactone lactonase YvrE